MTFPTTLITHYICLHNSKEYRNIKIYEDDPTKKQVCNLIRRREYGFR